MILSTTNLRANFLPNSFQDHRCVVVSADHLRVIWEDTRLAMNELVQDVFLQCLIVILYSVGLSHSQGVAAMRQYHRHNMMLVVQQVAAVDVSQWNFLPVP